MTVKNKQDDLLEQHFRGKQQMRPVFEELVRTIRSLDRKTKIIAHDSHIDLELKAQFGLVRVRKHSVELGLHLPDTPWEDRYRDATALNLGRITHLARLATEKDVDVALRKDIKRAMAASR